MSRHGPGISAYTTGLASAAGTNPVGITATVSGTRNALDVSILGSVAPASWNEIDLSYTGSLLTGVIYKLSGVAVVTLTLNYTGTQLTQVLKS